MKQNTALLVAISVYAFALSFLWNSFNPLLLPYLVTRLEPDLKNSYLGLISAAGLVIAVIVQPLAGGLSDRSRSRWGRRRPYIVIGTLADLVFLAVIALTGNIWALFVGYCLLQTSSNIAHGPYQGFIPDLVAERQKGLASGVKNLVELIALVLCSAIVGALLGRDQPGLAIAVMSLILLAAMIVTTLTVREQPARGDAAAAAVPPLSLGGVVKTLREHSVFAWYILSRFLILMGLAAVRTFVQNYLQDVLKVENPAALTGQLMTVLGLAVLVVVLPAGYLADRLDRKRLNIAAAFIGALGTVCFLLATSYVQIVVFGAIVGLAMGIFLSANWALAMDLIPAAEAALFLGLTNLATAGSGVTAAALGPMIDVLNRQAPGLGYNVLFVIATIAWLLGGLILVRLPVGRRRAKV